MNRILLLASVMAGAISLASVSTVMAEDAPPPPGQDAGQQPPPGQPGDQNAAGPQVDPPGRVGRLSFFDGNVSQFTPGGTDWAGASLNIPATTGSGFWTDAGAHAEIEIAGETVRLGELTELDVTVLDDQHTDLRVPQGSVSVIVGPNGPANIQMTVTTPRGVVDLNGPGRYEVIAGSADQPTRVSAFEGQATIEHDPQPFAVPAGQAGSLTGDQGEFSLAPAQPDDTEHWAEQREATLHPPSAAPLPPNVPPSMPGVQQLGQYGQWSTTPEYGAVWQPADLPADWAPYRYGHWAFVRPWGWTWVDDTPWGFAPFHYGRWVQVGGGWAWAPGVVVADSPPVYAPALVAFADPGVVVIAGVAPVVWFPLGFGEVFVPAYWASPRYFIGLNIYGVRRDRLDVFVHDYRPGRPFPNYHPDHFRTFVSAVPRGAFTGGRPVHEAFIRTSAHDFAHARVVAGPVGVRRTPAAFHGGPAEAPPRPHAAAAERRMPMPHEAARPGAAGPHPAAARTHPPVPRPAGSPPPRPPHPQPGATPRPAPNAPQAHPAPQARPAPAPRPAPAVHPAPRPAPAQHPAPQARPEPAERPAPREEKKCAPNEKC